VIIVDNALKAAEAADGKPIRVGMVGSGFMAQGLTNQIMHSVPGMRMSAIYGRRIDRALHCYQYAGRNDIVVASTQAQFDEAVSKGLPTVTEDPYLISRSPEIDVVIDVTGSVEFGARIALDSFDNGKPVVEMNAEVDATIGPILQTYAKRAGVILSCCDGDEPGLQMNLVRWAMGLGLIPRAVVNVKGLQDPYRNPTTQKQWAETWGQNTAMVTSFADGTKISCEQAIVANATGFGVLKRGMSRGIKYDGALADVQKLYDIDELRERGGIVDYIVGTGPFTMNGVKAFVLAEHTDPKQRHYLKLYKMGDGPLYAVFTPYHLVHFETPFSIARVVLLKDNLAPPLGGPVVEICAVAKRDLEPGEKLDDYGMYMTYGEAVNSDEMSRMRYLPEGLVEGCIVKRSIAKDQVITYHDVRLPEGRIADKLRAEQYRHFRGDTWLDEFTTTKMRGPAV
jgi:predicted homoserine dehydrogenase-like protein